MFTLQILDRGQTFLHTIADRPLLLGSAADADVRLAEEGVAPRHATLRMVQGECRLEPSAPVRVNGVAAGACVLRLGDRIELGGAIVVLGQTVARAASADDVLHEAPVRARRPAPRRSRPWLPLLAAAGVAGLVVWFVLSDGGSSAVRNELARVAHLRETARLDEAAAAIARLRQAWTGAVDDRLQRLQQEQAALTEIEITEARLRSAVLDPADTRKYGEWSEELQRLEQQGSPAERIAARVLRGNLRDTFERRPQPAPVATAPQVPAAKSGVVPAPAPAPVSPANVPAAATTAAAEVVPNAAADAWRTTVAEATRLADAGQFARAVAVLQSALGEVPDAAAAAEVRAVEARLRTAAVAALAPVLEQVRARLGAGEVTAARTLLVEARPRFPAGPDFAALDHEYARAERSIAAANQPSRPTAAPAPVDEAVRTATLAGLRAQMDSIRAAEERAAYAEVKDQLVAAAAAVRDRDPDFAVRLEARAADAGLLASFQAALTMALQAGRKVQVTTANGSRVALAAVEAGRLRLAADGASLAWSELGAPAFEEISTQLALTGDAALGAATWLYQRGESAVAERLLAITLRGDAGAKAAIDQVIARGRGEPFDPRGYTLGKDGFVSARSTAVLADAKKLLARLEAVLRDNNPAAREAFANEALAAGGDGAAALATALQTELGKQIQKLDASPLRKAVEKLAAQRELLDKARQHAKELIFDEVRYFYPYKPPAVSGDKAAEYHRVQAEIDERVAALRTLWQDDRVKLRVPATLRQDLDRVDWLARVLANLGALDASALAPIEWVRALPPGETVTVRDYCETVAERTRLADWRTIETYNTIVGRKLTSAQRELLKVTNEYRLMFQHRPLAIVLTCTAAAQGHAEEMSKLGYFAHMSPTPGRKTPYDRMRLAGYQSGVSENIALVDGATGAHVAWCHSSGHHRNLLDPGHTEIGIGSVGRYWVQNFGAGDGHREDAAWQQALAGKN